MSRRCKIPKEDWEFIKWYWDYQCVYCGSKRNLTKEHIIPISKGGPKYQLGNIIVACNDCNSTRSSIDINQYVSSTLLKKIQVYQILMSGKYKETLRLLRSLFYA